MNEKIKVPEMSYVGPERYVCGVLSEMRKCFETLNFSMIPSLIEEVQILVNRMEAAIEMGKDVKTLNMEIHELKQTRKALHAEVEKLHKKVYKPE